MKNCDSQIGMLEDPLIYQDMAGWSDLSHFAMTTTAGKNAENAGLVSCHIKLGVRGSLLPVFLGFLDFLNKL